MGITQRPSSPVGTTPGNPGMSEQDVLNMRVLRESTAGYIIDKDGVKLGFSRSSLPLYANILALDVAASKGMSIICEEYNFSEWVSNGEEFLPVNGWYRSVQENVLDIAVVVSLAVTWVASNNGGKVRLTTTANASHGIGVATVGLYGLVLKGTFTNWPANESVHLITAADDTSGIRTVDLATNWVVGMSTAPIFYTFAENIPVYRGTMDKLRKNSRIELNHNWALAVDGGATNRLAVVQVGTKAIQTWTINSATNVTAIGRMGLKNRGATNLNAGTYGSSSSGFAGANAAITLDEQTNAGISYAIFVQFPSTATNKGMKLNGITLDIFDFNEETFVPPTILPNWNPGNYIGTSSTDHTGVWSNTSPTNPGIVQRLQSDAASKWKGALARFNWPQLEGDTLGDYTPMNILDSYLAQISGLAGRSLILMIQLKTFGGVSDHSVPLYLRNSATYADPDGNGNGEYHYGVNFVGTGGMVPNMHVDAVQARFNALIDELKRRYKDNPNFEMICFTEANIQRPTGMANPWVRKDAWYDNMKECFQKFRTDMPLVNIIQWTSAARSDMSTYNPVGPTWTGYIPDLIAMGVGVGMTDGCPNDQGLTGFQPPEAHPGNLYFCQRANGLTPVMVHMSKESMHGTVVNQNQGCNCPDGTGTDQCNPQNTVSPYYPGPAQTRQAARDWAVGIDSDSPNATHIVWVHNTGNQSAVLEPQYNATSQPCKRAAMPPAFAQASDTPSGSYSGKKFNAITDAWIQAVASNSTTVTTRPTSAS